MIGEKSFARIARALLRVVVVLLLTPRILAAQSNRNNTGIFGFRPFVRFQPSLRNSWSQYGFLSAAAIVLCGRFEQPH